jgi:4-amino-4-deoxy-L-arabinose transferase-like glycosyltransferase
MIARIRRLVDGSPYLWMAALALLAAIVRLPFLTVDFSPPDGTGSIVPDSRLYLIMAEGIPGSLPTEAYRTIGYPLFIAPLHLLPGPATNAVVIAQHGLGIALVVAVFWIGDRYFGRISGIFAALLTAAGPPILMVEHYVLADFLLGLFILAGTVALIEAAQSPQPPWRALLLAGVLFGVAAQVKPVGQALIVVAPIVLAFSTRSLRATLRGSGLVAAAMLAVVLPWIAYNGVRYGEPTLSVADGTPLWVRVFDEDKEPIPTDTPDGRLAKRLYDRYLTSPSPGQADPRTLEVTESASYVAVELGKLGYSLSATEAFQRNLAIEAIKRDPVGYAEGTWNNLRRYASSNASSGLDVAHGFVAAQLGTAPGGLRTLSERGWSLERLLAGAAYLLSLALLAIPLLLFVGPGRHRIAALALLTSWGTVALASSLTNQVEPRFPAEIAPLQWILEAAAAVLVVTAVATGLRKWLPRPAAPSGDTGE